MRGQRRREENTGQTNGVSALSEDAVADLVDQGYPVEEIAALFNVPIKRIRRFLRKHRIGDNPVPGSGSLEPVETAYRSAPPLDASQLFGGAYRGRGRMRQSRSYSALNIDEICALYLDPTLSLGEIADAAHCDEETVMRIISEQLPGLLPHTR